MAGLIQSTDKSVLLKNQNNLDYRLTRLFNQYCLLRSLIEDGEGGVGIGQESDPIFTASPAFGITNANITLWDNTANNSIKSVELATFALLQSYAFTSEPIRFVIINDENKSQTDTVYNWNGRVLHWSAEVVDNFQPTIE